ncbi:hypothetical protein N2152v2_004826 [Parachlorella kessleri]
MATKAHITTAEALRETVETALEAEDITPLVRLVFDAHPADEPLPVPVPLDSESGTTTLDEMGALLQENPLEALLEVLGEVVEDKEAEIQQICRSNALEIASALHDLTAMQRGTAQLRQRLVASNSALQEGGRPFLSRLEEVAAISRVQQGVADARKAITTAIQILSLCARAGRYIEGRQLYKAFRVLEDIQRNFGSVLRGAADGRGLLLDLKDGASLSKLQAAPAPAPPLGAATISPAAHLGPLAPFLRDRVNELTAALEQKAMVDFNDWLVTVRTQARTIGMRAIRWAASEREHEERLARQRKEQLAALLQQQQQQQQGELRQHQVRAASLAALGRQIAAALAAPDVKAAAAATPLPLPGAKSAGSPARAPATPSSSSQGGSPTRERASSSPGPLVGRSSPTRSYRALRQQSAALAATAAGGSPGTAQPGIPAAAAAVASGGGSPPGTGASHSGGRAGDPATPLQQQAPQRGECADVGVEGTGDLLEGVDMCPLHRCAHIHACLRRLPALRDYYVANRRAQLDADLALQGPFLDAYQAYLTQASLLQLIVGYFLVEERVQRSTAGIAGVEGLDISPQVGAAWERAVAVLKGVLEGAFQGATAAAAMLTVKDFMLLVCLALERSGYHAVAIREILVNGRARYHELLAAATAEAVQAAVGVDPGLEPVEVRSEGRADELFRLLGLPATFHLEDAGNKRVPFKAPFTPLVPDLVRVIRGYVVDSVAYLQGLVSVGEVVPAARQYRDRMLARVVVDALQKRVDVCAGEPGLALSQGLQLVANVAALVQALAALDEFAVMRARGEPVEYPGVSRSPSPSPRGSPGPTTTTSHAGDGSGSRSQSRSPSPRPRPRSPKAAALEDSSTLEEDEEEEELHSLQHSNQQQQRAPSPPSLPAAASAAGSSRGSAPSTAWSGGGASPGGSTSSRSLLQPGDAANNGNAAAAGAGGQEQQHVTLSVYAGERQQQSTAGAAGSGGGATAAAAAFQQLLESAEALVVQGVAQRVSSLLRAGEELDWLPDKPFRALEGACSPYIEDIMLYLKECRSLMTRAAPDASVGRMMHRVFHYLAEAIMLQLMSGKADAIPAYNIFGLQRLFSDLGGLGRCAGSMAIPGLADELQEPSLFCELMVFGSLEELLKPELRGGGGKYAALDLRRVALVLDKYRELDRASGYASMHKSKQAERFISRKTVEGVARQLREASRAASSSGRPSERSYFSAFACSTKNSGITLLKGAVGDGTQNWTVTPLGSSNKIEGVRVYLQAGGRSSCGTYATAAIGCSGAVTLAAKLADAAAQRRQQWLFTRQADGSYVVSSVACGGKVLALPTSCSATQGQLLTSGSGAYRFTLAAAKAPLPPSPSPSSKVAVSASKSSDWGSGYEGSIKVSNNNPYDLLNWQLTFTWNDNYTWMGDVDLSWKGSQVILTPKEWTKRIDAGTTYDIRFGGIKQLPTGFAFAQLLPLLDPNNDPSLKTRGQFGSKTFAPYLDVLAWPTPQLSSIVDATGQLFYTLAFVTAKTSASGPATPAWGGVVDLADQFFYDQIRALRLRGGDVIVSFGGANGIELAQAITNVNDLVAAYQSVIDLYKLRWVDFDIEGGAVADTASVTRRNKAIRILQANNPALTISYCLPVLPSGLTADGVALLASAVAQGVRVDEVAVMTMDFGDSAAPNPAGKMGAYSIQAVQSTYAQAVKAGIQSPKIGAIPMIGINDVESEVFNLTDACQLADFAAKTSWMRTTRFWSVNRDNFNGFVGAAPDSSGVKQSPYAFTKLLKQLSCSTAAAVPALAPQAVGSRRLYDGPRPARQPNWAKAGARWPGLGPAKDGGQ